MLRLSALNGALIALALAVGAWGASVAGLFRHPLREAWPSYLLGLAAMVALGAAAGWLTARWDRGVVRALVWLLAATGMVWIIGHRPYDGQNLVIGQLDSRFRGLPVFPYDETAGAAMLVAGFFIILLLTLLGFLQDGRLEGIVGEVDKRGRLSGRGWFLLLLPLPLVVGAGLIADDMLQRPLRLAPAMVDDVISTGRAYTGDLFALSNQTGINYNAIKGLQQRMTGPYALHVAEADLGPSKEVMVTAAFDDNIMVNCSVIVDPDARQVRHCYDASAPYTRGFAALLTGEVLDCPKCRVLVTKEQQGRLFDQGRRMAGPPIVSRLAQWGSYVLMSARSPAGDRGIDCLFHGFSPVTLVRCLEAAA